MKDKKYYETELKEQREELARVLEQSDKKRWKDMVEESLMTIQSVEHDIVKYKSLIGKELEGLDAATIEGNDVLQEAKALVE